MTYLEEQTDRKAMINSIKNGDQPLPRVTHVSIAGTSSTEQPPLKDKSMWHMLGSEYGEQDRKAAVLCEYETFKDTEGELLLDTYIRCLQVINDLKKCDYSKDNCELNFNFLNNLQPEWKQYATMMRQNKNLLDINIDALYNILKQNQGDVNDAMKSKKKAITALLAKAFNRKKFYSKPTNNNLRTSSATSSANKKQEYVKSNDKKEENKVDEKKRDTSKVKCYNYSEPSSSSSDDKIVEVSYYTSESESEFEYETSYYYDNSTTCGLFVDNNDDQEIFHDSSEIFSENLIESQIDHNESGVTHNDSKDVAKLINQMIKEFVKEIAKNQKRLEKANQQSKDFENQTKFLQEKCDVLKNQTNTFEAERYAYMIRYSAYFDNDKQHRKQIADQETLFDKMSCQLVEFDENVRMLKNTVLEKDLKISELEECVRNKDLEIEKCLERLNECENELHKIRQTKTIHMIMPSKDKMYNGRKGIGFENPSYFCKTKDLRPMLYDERVICLGYTSRFLIHSDEALEIEKFKRARENKIEFSYDYESLNASYVNEKIIFSDDYFLEILNPDFEKIDSLFQQTSSLKPYVPIVILEKIIIDLEDEVVSLLNKEKENLKIIESLKSKGFESSKNAISESENQSENDCQEVEKECDNSENSNVIAQGMFKLSVSQSVSPISMTKTSCASNSVENVKRYSCKDLLLCNNSHHRATQSAHACNNARNAYCNLYDVDVNDLFVFDDIVQICLWIIDSGCSKHMTGNRALLTNFVKKFLGTVRFGNNDFAMIAGYGDVVIGSMTIKRVYYVKGFGYNLFSVGQFCDKGLKVAFRKSTCFVRNTDGVDLLTGDRSSNLYTIALNEIVSNSSACLLAKASSL
nr:integrase, catalytic region, zinc finger, CCHC-type, peptidase aspartic, catalytic [Tanacetum cinerariifolium]